MRTELPETADDLSARRKQRRPVPGPIAAPIVPTRPGTLHHGAEASAADGEISDAGRTASGNYAACNVSSQCEPQYHSCYRSCGGQINEYQVCVAACE